MKLKITSLFKVFIAVLAISSHFNVSAQVQKLPVISLHINNNQVNTEIAATEQSRNFGLMYRNHLDQDSGMLFVFEQTSQPCFWMKNTPLALSIAFIDAHGHITDLINMQPKTLDSHCPTKAVKYALEVNQGWFDKNNINVGDKICLNQNLNQDTKYPAKELGINQSLKKDLELSFNCN